MNTLVTIQAVSYKNRSIMAAGTWAKVNKSIDLNWFKVGKKYMVETEKGFDGKWYVMKVKKEK